MRQLLSVFLTLISLCANSQTQPGISLGGDSSKTSIITKLGIPFGTIAKLEVEIFYGDSLHMKAYEGIYLLKINDVNNKKMNDTVLLTFIDETGSLANDDPGLYKQAYGQKSKSLTSTQMNKIREKYIGKKLIVMAYETGHFTGIPKDYFKYRPEIADRGFHFEHSLVVVSGLKE